MSGFYLQGIANCLLQCPVSYYPSVQSGVNVCLGCDSRCKDCDGPTSTDHCLSCSPGTLPLTYLSGKSCLEECPRGKYKSPNAQDCLSCHSTCSSCSGPEPCPTQFTDLDFDVSQEFSETYLKRSDITFHVTLFKGEDKITDYSSIKAAIPNLKILGIKPEDKISKLRFDLEVKSAKQKLLLHIDLRPGLQE